VSKDPSDAFRVLYIDDDEGFARLAMRSLGREGFVVTHAPHGEAGLALLGARNFDVIALDHIMPGRSGGATLAAIVRLPDAPPVVYVTGMEDSRVAVTALKAGAADYVLKDATPSFFPLLAQALRQAVAASQARREREQARVALVEARDRAEVLLRECYHRVANSLALVSSMAQMQASALDDEAARAALFGFERRVAAIAQVHRRLYTSDDVSQVALDQYLGGLVDELRRSIAQESGAVERIELSADPISFPTDSAVTLGVILSELVTNACKYAYRSGQGGEVRVALRRVGDSSAQLSVEDDGVGFEAGDPEGTGTGLRMLRALSRGLGAEVARSTLERGARIAVSFPLRPEPLRPSLP
jgi:two-component sensor histidine kinase/CheY-like chemotaxis protein